MSSGVEVDVLAVKIVGDERRIDEQPRGCDCQVDQGVRKATNPADTSAGSSLPHY